MSQVGSNEKVTIDSPRERSCHPQVQTFDVRYSSTKEYYTTKNNYWSSCSSNPMSFSFSFFSRKNMFSLSKTTPFGLEKNQKNHFSSSLLQPSSSPLSLPLSAIAVPKLSIIAHRLLLKIVQQSPSTAALVICHSLLFELPSGTVLFLHSSTTASRRRWPLLEIASLLGFVSSSILAILDPTRPPISALLDPTPSPISALLDPTTPPISALLN